MCIRDSCQTYVRAHPTGARSLPWSITGTSLALGFASFRFATLAAEFGQFSHLCSTTRPRTWAARPRTPPQAPAPKTQRELSGRMRRRLRARVSERRCEDVRHLQRAKRCEAEDGIVHAIGHGSVRGAEETLRKETHYALNAFLHVAVRDCEGEAG